MRKYLVITPAIFVFAVPAIAVADNHDSCIKA
jgi:hypothetical protein